MDDINANLLQERLHLGLLQSAVGAGLREWQCLFGQQRVLDTQGVANRKQRRSKYGAKRPK